MREGNSQRIGTTLQYNSAGSKNLHDFGYDGFVADDKNLDEETKTKKKIWLVILSNQTATRVRGESGKSAGDVHELISAAGG
jgi:hypothetical protein